METRVIQYCYLLTEEVEHEVFAGLEDSSPVHFYPQDNFTVMVTEFPTEWEPGLDQLNQGLDFLRKGLDESLLVSATVLVSSGGGWEEGVGRAERLTGRGQVLEVKLSGGRLARLGWQWPEGRAFYFYQADKGGAVDERDRDFLLRGLALLDGCLAKMDQLTTFNRERRETVSAENRDLEAGLSKVLYSHFVPRGDDRKTLEDLEEAVNGLSTAYGMLAGNYRLVREGHLVLEDHVNSFLNTVEDEADDVFDRETVSMMLEPYEQEIAKLKNLEYDLQTSRQNFQAGIDMVRSRIDILMSRKSLEMQGRSLVFQVAAGFIEFVIIAYYTMSIWKAIAPELFHDRPSWVFLISVFFSGGVTYATHLLAERIQGEKVSALRIIFSMGALALTLLAMGYLSLPH